MAAILIPLHRRLAVALAASGDSGDEFVTLRHGERIVVSHPGCVHHHTLCVMFMLQCAHGQHQSRMQVSPLRHALPTPYQGPDNTAGIPVMMEVS